MGAAALCFGGAGAPVFRAFILESVYHDLAGAYVSRVGARFPSWFHRFRRGVFWVTERRLGLRVAQVSPAAHIGHLSPRPVLLMTGSQDPYAPPEDMQRLYERCGEPREKWVVPGAAHMDVCERGGEFYRETVLSFLQRRLAAVDRQARGD